MQHLMTLRVYHTYDVHTDEALYHGVFRNEVSNDCRLRTFKERTRAMEYCKGQLTYAMSFMPNANLYMKQVVRKGVWCYNVFGIDRNEAKRDAADLWALQTGGKT